MEDINMEPSPLPLDLPYDLNKDSNSQSGASSPRSPTRPRLPEGQCQAILTGRNAGAGHRCPCNHFTLNSSSPATICDCGHMSCYHTMTYNTFESVEFRKMQEQIRAMNDMIKSQAESNQENVTRISSLEDSMEKTQEEIEQGTKESHMRLAMIWQQVDTIEKRGKDLLHTVPNQGIKIRALEQRLDAIHSDFNDASISLEERLDRLEANEGITSPPTRDTSMEPPSINVTRSHQQNVMQQQQQQQPLRSETIRMILQQQQQQQQQQNLQRQQQFIQQQQQQFQRQQHLQMEKHRAAMEQANANSQRSGQTPLYGSGDARPTSAILPATEAPRRIDASNPPRQTLRPVSIKFPATSNLSESWTVHISLLPSKDLPFPYEKDTRAYKRCLSRGLHRYVVVQDHSAKAFAKAVSGAFNALLQNRTWMPLQAKLCDAQDLQGLPMLRQLDKSLQHDNYDLDFLRTHCAVLCPGGKLDSLYIAMKSDVLSWDFLRTCPTYMDGLDSSWDYDSLIDNEGAQVGDLMIAGPMRKRHASEISFVPAIMQTPFNSVAMPSSSNASASDNNSSRPKMARTAPSINNVPEVPRAVETV